MAFVDILSGRMPQEERLANYSGATAPDFHRISFCPALSYRLPTDVCKGLERRATNRRWLERSTVNSIKLARWSRSVNLGRLIGDSDARVGVMELRIPQVRSGKAATSRRQGRIGDAPTQPEGPAGGDPADLTGGRIHQAGGRHG